MRVRILGSAAGGGYPQWNCGCPGCRVVRSAEGLAEPRQQSSLAVRPDGGPWHLVNASPDVRQQLELIRDPSDTQVRSNPFAGVILSDAEIDHTAGLIVLRESSTPLRIYGTAAVREALTLGFPVLDVLEAYCGVEWTLLEPDNPLDLVGPDGRGMRVEAFEVPGDPPLYMRRMSTGNGAEPPPPGTASGLVFTDLATGSTAVYAPAVGELNEDLLARLAGADVALLDGTFWSNEELTSQGVGKRTALDMGHLPLSGLEGSLERLKRTGGVRKVLVHINNSNPILLRGSEERRAVEAAGVEISYDGMTVDL
jgi:pyrroloquinoline quinone biosynthesis protein B